MPPKSLAGFARVELTPAPRPLESFTRERGLRLEGVTPQRVDFGALLP